MLGLLGLLRNNPLLLVGTPYSLYVGYYPLFCHPRGSGDPDQKVSAR